MRYLWGMGDTTRPTPSSFSWHGFLFRCERRLPPIRSRDTPLSKGPRTWLGLTSTAIGLIYRTHWCLRWMLSSCAFRREYAIRCQRPSKSLMSLGKCVSGRLSSDCLLQLYAIWYLKTSSLFWTLGLTGSLIFQTSRKTGSQLFLTFHFHFTGSRGQGKKIGLGKTLITGSRLFSTVDLTGSRWQSARPRCSVIFVHSLILPTPSCLFRQLS